MRIRAVERIGGNSHCSAPHTCSAFTHNCSISELFKATSRSTFYILLYISKIIMVHQVLQKWQIHHTVKDMKSPLSISVFCGMNSMNMKA